MSGPGSSSQTRELREGLHLTDLEDDLDFENMRENEGEAAEYGIYFDDTSYDYMQHLQDIGEGGGDAHFIDAIPVAALARQALHISQSIRGCAWLSVSRTYARHSHPKDKDYPLTRNLAGILANPTRSED